jgi:hypothetical protein
VGLLENVDNRTSTSATGSQLRAGLRRVAPYSSSKRMTCMRFTPVLARVLGEPGEIYLSAKPSGARKNLVLTFEYAWVSIRSVHSLSSVIVDAPFRCIELGIIVY